MQQISNNDKVIVIIDKDGNYLTMEDGNILAIDMIDDKSFDSLSIVSSEWLNKTLEETKGKLEIRNMNIEEVDNKELIETSNIPTGVLPPSNYPEETSEE